MKLSGDIMELPALHSMSLLCVLLAEAPYSIHRPFLSRLLIKQMEFVLGLAG